MKKCRAIKRSVLAVEIGATSAAGILLGPKGSTTVTLPTEHATVDQTLEAFLKKIFSLPRTSKATVGRVVICSASISQKATKVKLKEACRRFGLRVSPEIYPDIFSTIASELGTEPGLVVVVGTGSCVMAQDQAQQIRRSGGWGTPLGDEGSATSLGLQGLRAILASYDGQKPGTLLTREILRRLGLKQAPQVLDWYDKVSKREIAQLAPIVFACANEGDPIAKDIIASACKALLGHIESLVTWLQQKGVQDPRIVLAGGVLEHQPTFRAALQLGIERMIGKIPIHLAKGIKGQGALRLATDMVSVPRIISQPDQIPTDRELCVNTEDHNLASKNIDTLSSEGVVEIIQGQDAALPHVLGKAAPSLAKAVDEIVATLRGGGRVFYAGAGTSGRIAWMDAVELPPTFGINPGLFEVILAGGREALEHSVEGAEDDGQDAVAQLKSRKITTRDILIGITASGTTPFVLAAVKEAKHRGVKTIGILCNEGSPLEKICDLPIVAPVGPEVIAGSTRMKAGTATKMILNTLSTATMIRLGKVYDHWMIDVKPSNAKLRKRASRIIQGLTGVSEKRSQQLLRGAQGNAKAAILMAKRNLSLPQAQQVLLLANGHLRKALQQKN